MSERPEPAPTIADKASWRVCIVATCDARIDPREHSFRCAAHRASTRQRHVALVSADEAAELVATATLYDPDLPRRLLDHLAAEHPNLIAAAIAELERQARR